MASFQPSAAGTEVRAARQGVAFNRSYDFVRSFPEIYNSVTIDSRPVEPGGAALWREKPNKDRPPRAVSPLDDEAGASGTRLAQQWLGLCHDADKFRDHRAARGRETAAH
jgi:hypothetical protein